MTVNEAEVIRAIGPYATAFSLQLNQIKNIKWGIYASQGIFICFLSRFDETLFARPPLLSTGRRVPGRPFLRVGFYPRTFNFPRLFGDGGSDLITSPIRGEGEKIRALKNSNLAYNLKFMFPSFLMYPQVVKFIKKS